MNAARLQDRIGRGMGVAARNSGAPVSVYRPKTTVRPIVSQNRIVDLCALFLPSGAGGSVGYGMPLWRGVYDTAYTKAGDYLVGDDATFFIASQKPGLPAQCVITNRVVSIVRPAASVSGGYSGFYSVSATPILTEWCASLLEAGGRSASASFEGTRLGGWTVLLPPYSFGIQAGDLINDDTNGAYVVGAVEEGTLGWRLTALRVSA